MTEIEERYKCDDCKRLFKNTELALQLIDVNNINYHLCKTCAKPIQEMLKK